MPASSAETRNAAIVSENYLNLNLRLGYHFTVVDCYLGEGPEVGCIFFRSSGAWPR